VDVEAAEAVSRRARHAAIWRWATVVVTVVALGGAAVLAPGPTGQPGAVLAVLLFAGSSVHVASTGWFATSPEVKGYATAGERRGLIWWPLGLLGTGALVAALAPSGALHWLLLLVFAWQFRHFQKQNLGVMALTATSLGVSTPCRVERRVVALAGTCGIAGLVTRPSLLQLDLYRLPHALHTVAAISYVASVLAGSIVLMRRTPGQRPASYLAACVVALLFPLPIFLFTSPYAAVGGMTVAHGAQYLVLMTLVAAGEARTTSPQRPLGPLTLLGAIALGGGAALGVAAHLHLSESPALRGLFGLYLGFLCTHFVVDARLWRLSSRFPRAFLGARLAFLIPPVPTAPRS
jgi:hypothetical protein